MAKNNKFSDASRIYTLISGEKFPSVTTVLAMKDKSGPLMGWAVKMMTECAIEKIIASTETLSKDYVVGIINDAKKEYRRRQDTALDIGSKVHHAIEGFTKASCSSEGLKIVQSLPEYPQIEKPFGAFLKWYNEHSFSLIEGERIVYNKEHRYAGQLDAIALVNSKVTLVDYKSSTSMREEYLWQVAAYSKAYEQNTNFKIDRHGCLRLDKVTGEPEWVEWTQSEIDEAFEKFLCLNKLWWLMNKDKGE